jgi:hypothetical protein
MSRCADAFESGFEALQTATATLLKRQKPIGRSGVAWSGRRTAEGGVKFAAQYRFRRCERAPAARSAASA